MLIPLSTIYKKHRPTIKGIIHVGAHLAQEHGDYTAHGVNRVAYIEASTSTFQRLSNLSLAGEVRLYNVALADYEGDAVMYKETVNDGQSSSLLKPGTHTQHYPNIVFNVKEAVKVTTLDRLNLTGYNFLNIDVQGAELLVLKGGPETLKSIDYIYLEVNREQVYEGCAQINEIDTFLHEFKRVETVWTGQGWGDAFYIRKPKPPFEAVQPVPKLFQLPHPFPYPGHNKMEFERWFFLNTQPGEIKGRTYLPVFWTAYYVRNKFGKDKSALHNLQAWLNRLPKRPYFTIVQYDDGILNDVSGLDLKIFSMGGGRVDYPLPLIAEPLPALAPADKDILCSFVGRITHPIRQQIVDKLTGVRGFYISTKPHKPGEYANILNRSRFVLCPRGYGKTSFRIQEALQFGATPVYISDEHIVPHGDEACCISITPDRMVSLKDDLTKHQDYPPYSKAVYEKYFTYAANKQLILQNI